MDKAFLIAVLELIIKYGLPNVVNILKAFEKPVVTQEDIEGLRELVKDPDEYIKPPTEV